MAATLGLVALAAADLADRLHVGQITRVLAALVVLAPIAWEPIPGLATVMAALLLVRPRQTWLIVATFALVAILFVFTGDRTIHMALSSSFRERSWRGRLRGMIMGLILASFIPLTPDHSAMAAPLALMALSMAASPEQHPLGREERDSGHLDHHPPRRHRPARLLSVAACQAVARRHRPVRSRRPEGGSLGILLIVVLAILDTGHPPEGLLSPAALAAGVLLVGAWIHLPATGTLLLPADTALVIDLARPRLKAPLDEQQVRALVIESSLSNGAGLENGTAIATVRLRGEGDRTEAWVLRAGTDTGEWAARRPDVAAASVLESPPAWISWVAGDFFGQRYRVRWAPERASFSSPLAGPFTELTVERNPGLPAAVSLAIHRVEVRH